MEVLKWKFTINPKALLCQICCRPPKPHWNGSHLYLCGAGHVVCGSCIRAHKMLCGGSLSSDCCRLLEDVASRIEVKCGCEGYFPYCKLSLHKSICLEGKFCTSAWLKCRLKTELVRCSICGATLRPPVFKGSFHDRHLACADCYRADTNKDNFVSCPDLDYLFKVMMKKTHRPWFSPCDEDETNSAVASSNIIIGKTNRKAPSKVGKPDKHIVECHEDMSEDGSNDKMDEEEDESPREEMEVVELSFTINPTDLECRTCRFPPKPHGDGSHLYLCGAGHVVCRSCMRVHKASCGASHSCSRFLAEIASRIEIKCACAGYFQYCKLKGHQSDCPASKYCTSAWSKCRLKAELVRCSICGATLRPPIFKRSFHDRLACADCYHADTNKDNFIRCPDLDYLFKVMMKKTHRPWFSPCDKDETNSAVASSNIIIGKTNRKAPSKVGKTDKHIVECCEDMCEDGSNDKMDEEEDESSKELETGKRVDEASLKTSTYNKKANIATASGKKTDEYESTRPQAGNSTNIGKSKGKAPPKVRKMDNHIVDSDDDSSDDIHPETGKRVAEILLKTSAYNKKAKIATPSGDKMGAPVVTLHPANN